MPRVYSFHPADSVSYPSYKIRYPWSSPRFANVLSTILIASVLGWWPLPGRAQSLSTGGLRGSVQDREGKSLDQSRVAVVETRSGLARSIITDRSGTFSFGMLPAGEYEVSVEAIGYRRQWLKPVWIRAGEVAELDVMLEWVEGQADEAETIDLARERSDPVVESSGRWFPAWQLNRLPVHRREFVELGRLSSFANEDLEIEGLPPFLSGIAIDGVPFVPARHPNLSATLLPTAAFPLSNFRSAELVTPSEDVEWSGASSGWLSGYTQRGSAAFEASGFGVWSPGPLHFSDASGVGSATPTDLFGGALFSGPIGRRSARFLVGAEARRFERIVPSGLAGDEDSRVIQIARDSYGVDLTGIETRGIESSTAVSGFGGLDWQLAGAHLLSVRANLGVIPSADWHALGTAGGMISRAEGRDFLSEASLLSDLGSDWGSELRLSFGSSGREYGDEGVGSDDMILPTTRVVNAGFGFGATPLAGRFAHSALRASGALFHRTGRHRLKGGLVATVKRDEQERFSTTSEFLFEDVEAFARGEGAATQRVGTGSTAEFTTSEISAFLQDIWDLYPGFEVLLGVRYDRESRPASEILRNERWFALTGLATNDLEGAQHKISPRIAASWNVAQRDRWFLRAAAGIHHDNVDPGSLAELIALSGGNVAVQRAVGQLPDWPLLPDATAELEPGVQLALPGPDFNAPRTARASFGVTRLHRAATALHLFATYRRTDFLPRRGSLNLFPVPVGRDQYERPLFGELVQQGSLLIAEPGSNRRFSEFDQVSVIYTDGRSEYRGITAAVETEAMRPFRLFGSYTYSQTTDDWLLSRSAGADPQLSPFPDGLAETDWAEGRSDFDIPHRLVLGGEARIDARFDPRIALFYRYRSGYPFTPGFSAGVDANADGSGLNDPAFVDDGIAGVSELVGSWECLQQQVGRFAERNSCRAPGVHTLDLRLGMNILRGDRYSAELVLDGLNLIGGESGVRDQALYRIDPSREVTRSPGSSVAVVPLIANPGFGELLFPRDSGRTLRLGLQINY